jgi:phage gpG-like protein
MAFQVKAELKLDQSAINKAMTGRGGPVWQAALRAGGYVRDQAKLDLTNNGLVNTGKLRNSIESQVSAKGTQVVATVGTDVEYARFVHDGTKSPIVPRRARALRFKPKGSSVFVFAAKVRGTKETGRYSPFMTNALKKLKTSDYA